MTKRKLKKKLKQWPDLGRSCDFSFALHLLNVVLAPDTFSVVCNVPPQPGLGFQGLAAVTANIFLQAQVKKVDVVPQGRSLPKLFGAVLTDMLAVG